MGFHLLGRLGVARFLGRHDLAVLHHEFQVGQDVFRGFLHLDQPGREDGVAADGGLAYAMAVGALGKGRGHAFHDVAVPGQAEKALIAPGAHGAGRIGLAAELVHAEVVVEDERVLATGRGQFRMAAGDGLPLFVEDEDDDVVGKAVQLGENPFHFADEIEDEAEYAKGRAALRIADGLGIEEHVAAPRDEVACPVGLHIAVGGKRLGKQRIGAAADGVFRVEMGAHHAVGVADDDFVVDGVLVAVLAQPRFDGLAGLRGAGLFAQEPDDVVVGGEKAHIGRALEKIAFEDVDGHLGHGRDFQDHLLRVFQDEGVDEIFLQGGEIVLGGDDEVDERLGDAGAIDFAGQRGPGPLAIQPGEPALAGGHAGHGAKQGFFMGFEQFQIHGVASHRHVVRGCHGVVPPGGQKAEEEGRGLAAWGLGHGAILPDLQLRAFGDNSVKVRSYSYELPLIKEYVNCNIRYKLPKLFILR